MSDFSAFSDALSESSPHCRRAIWSPGRVVHLLGFLDLLSEPNAHFHRACEVQGAWSMDVLVDRLETSLNVVWLLEGTIRKTTQILRIKENVNHWTTDLWQTLVSEFFLKVLVESLFLQWNECFYRRNNCTESYGNYINNMFSDFIYNWKEQNPSLQHQKKRRVPCKNRCLQTVSLSLSPLKRCSNWRSRPPQSRRLRISAKKGNEQWSKVSRTRPRAGRSSHAGIDDGCWLGYKSIDQPPSLACIFFGVTFEHTKCSLRAANRTLLHEKLHKKTKNKTVKIGWRTLTMLVE